MRKHNAGQRLIIDPETELAGALAQIVFVAITKRCARPRTRLRRDAQFHLSAACIRCHRWIGLIEQIANLRSQRRFADPQNRSMRLT